ncbi:hypothetical protein Q0Z83_020850 [Actinoplanes sichuanensis]|uniref:Uncharacterized protein n=1 Tax=Actinoplanes sichuanensis TaxID=512349 RepID=A0ABW4AKC1_9ACTN|nr:hypothetical protein [Actinoplanes sichuanensis]BEL03894.1 hypothetical protein Q0Z83_020850 [Actinoplanes sichuanensis]
MVAYSGFGFLVMVWWAVLAGTFFVTVDGNAGDWVRACLNTAIAALVVAAVNLVLALGVNRDENGWTGRHSTSGTPLQGQTPVFLATAAGLLLAWATQWITWPGAVLGLLLVVGAYYAVPAIRRGRERSRISARRRAAAEDVHGLSFRRDLPELTARWTLAGPRATSPGSVAGMLNAPSKAALRHPFAVASGVSEGRPFTIADAYVTMPFAVCGPWQQRLITVCAVHLGIALPHTRITLAEGEVWCDTEAPAVAQQLLTTELLSAMIQIGLVSIEFQGRDALVMLELERVHPDPDGRALGTVEQLLAVTAVLPAHLSGWTAELPGLPTTVTAG